MQTSKTYVESIACNMEKALKDMHPELLKNLRNNKLPTLSHLEITCYITDLFNENRPQ